MDINKKMTDKEFIDGVTKLEAPYDIYKFDCKNMIQNSDVFKLRTALLSMKFKKKSCDLYSFHQSPDFYRIANSQRPREVQQFLEVLREIKLRVGNFLAKEFNLSISVSCSKYDYGDYLLCHDDCVDDRSVAFIYYLNYDWLEEWGGTLDVYSTDKNNNADQIVHRINPESNTMIFFPVGKNTYHQVAENVSKFSRISINGWFHSEHLCWEITKQLNESPSPIYLPVRVSKANRNVLSASIDPMFDQYIYREAVREMFTKCGYIMCEAFFRSNVVKNLSNQMYSNDLPWKTKGPLNKRHYKYLDLDKLPFQILFIVNILKTDQMFSFFKDCTGLELIGVNIEVQRWHGGHYIVSGGNYSLNPSVLSVYLFFSQCFGKMMDDNKDDLHYVFEEQNTMVPKFACKPQDNTIFMVKRDSNLESYVKYCKKVDGHAWTVVIAHYLIKQDYRISI